MTLLCGMFADIDQKYFGLRRRPCKYTFPFRLLLLNKSDSSSSRTPAATTVCLNGGGQGVTVTVNRGNPTTVTQTNLVYQTTQISGTIWVGYVNKFFYPGFIPRDTHCAIDYDRSYVSTPISIVSKRQAGAAMPHGSQRPWRGRPSVPSTS